MARRVYNTDCARSTWLSEPGDNVSGAGDGSRHGDQFSSEPIRLSTRPSIGPGVEAANGEFTLLGLLLPKGQRNQLKDLQREHRRIIQIEGTFYSGRSYSSKPASRFVLAFECWPTRIYRQLARPWITDPASEISPTDLASPTRR